jgi:hypothetical protein
VRPLGDLRSASVTEHGFEEPGRRSEKFNAEVAFADGEAPTADRSNPIADRQFVLTRFDAERHGRGGGL